MARYKVLLHGLDVVLQEVGCEPQRGGFYVNCCVEAASPSEAEQLALALLQEHRSFQELRSWPPGSNVPVRVSLESISRIRWRRLALGIAGLILYPDDEVT